MKRMLHGVDVMVAPSEFVKEKYVEFGLDQSRILVIPSGVDIDAIRRSHKAVLSDKLRFGYFGGASEIKGLSIVLDAFNQIADDTVELVIAGTGTERALSTLRLPRQAIQLGEYSPDRVGEVLSKIDVIVVPSRCHESYNLLLREAFAAKIPAIVSNLRAQSDAVRDGIDGLHFRSGDVLDLVSKMQMLKDRRRILEELRRGIPNVPEIDGQVSEIVKILEDLISRRKTTPDAVSGNPQFHDASYIAALSERAVKSLTDALSVRAREATILTNELYEIKRSVGYKFIRFYGRRIDKLFPDDTRRGDLRRRMTYKLRLLLKST